MNKLSKKPFLLINHLIGISREEGTKDFQFFGATELRLTTTITGNDVNLRKKNAFRFLKTQIMECIIEILIFQLSQI